MVLHGRRSENFKAQVICVDCEKIFEVDAPFMEWYGIGDRNLGNPRINMMNNNLWRSLVTGDRWKLNLCAGDQCELFDLNTDPFEERNLFDDPVHRDRIREMTARIRVWQHETDDDAPLRAV